MHTKTRARLLLLGCYHIIVVLVIIIRLLLYHCYHYCHYCHCKNYIISKQYYYYNQY